MMTNEEFKGALRDLKDWNLNLNCEFRELVDKGFTKKGKLNDQGIKKIKSILEIQRGIDAAINRYLKRLENVKKNEDD